MKRCKLSDLDSLFALISSKRELYLPVDGTDGRAHYSAWHEGVELSQKTNTVCSAKDFFFPQSEDLVEFRLSGNSISVLDIRTEKYDFVLFGVRACDARSFDILDRVFLCEPVDSFYASRREHALIMTLACNRPSETCFCSAFGIDAANPGGDIECRMDAEYLYLEARTDKGSTFMAELSNPLESCAEDAADDIIKLIQDRIAGLPIGELPLDEFGAGTTEKYFSDTAWKKLSESCLGCGSCTYTCPTCQCYDIKEFDTGKAIKRYRCWDSCMYSEFTKMSAGQPRPTQLERFRQRFMHKLVYFPENNEGIFGCVGCGRCLIGCPISMNIVKVIRALGGKEDE